MSSENVATKVHGVHDFRRRRTGLPDRLQKEVFQCLPVYGGQRFDIGEKNLFVDLVDAFGYRAEFDDLWTDAGDETADRTSRLSWKVPV